MSSFGRPVLAVALLLMLAPRSRDAGIATTGAARAGVELVRSGKPAYPPCAGAKPRQLCMDATGAIVNTEGHRRWH